MEKQIKKKIEVTEKKYYCDICEPETRIGKYNCIICERDICNKHIIYHPDDYSDYSNKYCTECWSILKPYKKIIYEIQEVADSKIDSIYKLAKNECLKNAKNNRRSNE